MNSQTEEMMERFKSLIPMVAVDSRFVLSFTHTALGQTIPIVYLAEDETGDQSMPARFLMIMKKDEVGFALKLEGFFDCTHFIFPVAWWPYLVSKNDLDRLVIEIFEGWLRTIEAVTQQIQRFQGPDITSIPL